MESPKPVLPEASPTPEEAIDLEGVRQQLRDAGVPFEEAREWSADGVVQVIDASVQCGHKHRTLRVGPHNCAIALTTKISELVALGPYDALWRRDEGIIECGLESIAPGAFLSPPSIAIMKRLFPPATEGAGEDNLEVRTSSPVLSVAIAEMTAAIHTNALFLGLLWGRLRRGGLVLRLEGVRAASHDHALRLLEDIGNSLLFRVDISTGINLQMRRDARRRFRRLRKGDGKGFPCSELRFRYPAEPMGLYWYGRSASSMPLLQFLAFYQVLEFFFPMYLDREAQEVVRLQLHNPTFDSTLDADVARVVRAVRSCSAGGNRGSEVHQLKDTLRAVVPANAIVEWLERNEPQAQFLSGNDARRLSEHRVNPKHMGMDLRDQATQRLYDIRCRLVHSKGDDESAAPILPFSEEAQLMEHDIAFAEFLAQQALVAASAPLLA